MEKEKSPPPKRLRKKSPRNRLLTSDHVHRPGPRKVDHAPLEQQRPVGPVHVRPAVDRPDRVHDDGVHPGRHEERVEEVGLEARALGDRAADDRAGRGGERPLEDPLVVLRGPRRAALGELAHAEELGADEGVGRRPVSVRKSIAELLVFFIGKGAGERLRRKREKRGKRKGEEEKRPRRKKTKPDS